MNTESIMARSVTSSSARDDKSEQFFESVMQPELGFRPNVHQVVYMVRDATTLTKNANETPTGSSRTKASSPQKQSSNETQVPVEVKNQGRKTTSKVEPFWNKILEGEDQTFRDKFFNLLEQIMKEKEKMMPGDESQAEDEEETDEEDGNPQKRGGRATSASTGKRGRGRPRKQEEEESPGKRGGSGNIKKRTRRSVSPPRKIKKQRERPFSKDIEREDEELEKYYDTTRRGGPSQADRAKGGRHSGYVRRRERELLEGRSLTPIYSDEEEEEEEEGFEEDEDRTRGSTSTSRRKHRPFSREIEREDEKLEKYYDTTRRGGPSEADRAKGGRHSGYVRRREKELREGRSLTPIYSDEEEEEEGFEDEDYSYKTRQKVTPRRRSRSPISRKRTSTGRGRASRRREH